MRAFFAAVSGVAIVISFVFAGARVAYKVNYNGKNIATVQTPQEAEVAVSTVARIVESTKAQAQLEKPELTAVLTVRNDTDSKTQVVDAIIKNTDNLVEAAVVSVDGNKLFMANAEQLNRIIDTRLHAFDIVGVECESVFDANLDIRLGYDIKENIATEQSVIDFIGTLPVRTTAIETEETEIPFGIVEQKTDEKLKGYRETVIKGINGLKRTGSENVYLNGELIEQNVLNEEDVILPADEIVLVGTAKPTPAQVSETAKTVLSNGFVFPVPRGTWKISSYYGDGRNHKGVDVCANKGTPLMAVNAGKVTYASWRKGYGLCIIIDHGDGVQTLYGHEDSISVSVGEIVSAGDVIGTIGMTGDAYGNHVHFEVIVGGKNVDPAPFLGV